MRYGLGFAANATPAKAVFDALETQVARYSAFTNAQVFSNLADILTKAASNERVPCRYQPSIVRG
jgi:hypothetical protein